MKSSALRKFIKLNCIKNNLRNAYRKVLANNGEVRTLAAFLKAVYKDGVRALDVGCGYGRNMKLLRSLGFDVLGVDVNEKIVDSNRSAGFSCVTVTELARNTEKFDLLLMAHVIEHLSPAELVIFLDGYLDRLRPGGHLIIATPLASSNFYDDFDHIRPYQPMGLLMVFGSDNAQVQYYARNKLELRDIWFRRGPFRCNFFRARYIFSPTTRFLQLIDFCGALAFRASGGLIGRTDGWVGLFRKVS